MGMLGKIKKFFEEEEEIEIEESELAPKPKKEKPRKENPIQTTIKRTERVEPPQPQRSFEPPVDVPPVQAPAFKKPVIFDDKDFVADEVKVKPPKPVVKMPTKKPNLYQQNKIKPQEKKVEEKQPEKKVFRPTPIISPVYGILDKDYRKEELVPKPKVDKPSKKMDVDMIRNKAYGTLEDELEDTIFGSFEPMAEEMQPEVEEVMPSRAEKNRDLMLEFELEELATRPEEDPQIVEDVDVVPIVEEEEPIGITDELDETRKPKDGQDAPHETAAEDLFELIDSMYEEKE